MADAGSCKRLLAFQYGCLQAASSPACPLPRLERLPTRFIHYLPTLQMVKKAESKPALPAGAAAPAAVSKPAAPAPTSGPKPAIKKPSAPAGLAKKTVKASCWAEHAGQSRASKRCADHGVLQEKEQIEASSLGCWHAATTTLGIAESTACSLAAHISSCSGAARPDSRG